MVGGVRGSVRMDVCSGAGGCVGSPDALVYEASMVQEALVGRQRNTVDFGSHPLACSLEGLGRGLRAAVGYGSCVLLQRCSGKYGVLAL